MASRKTIFTNDEFYHIYNRGVEKRDIFMDDRDYIRFLISMKLFNANKAIGSIRDYKRKLSENRAPNSAYDSSNVMNAEVGSLCLVEIIAYCLNSNHYHMILRQKIDGGISRFMKNLGGGYTSYFNKKYNRSGSLFQGRFKSIHIDSNEYLLHLSAYINQNDFIHGGDKNWKYSSYLDYVGKREGGLCQKDDILGQFRNINDYAEFVKNNMLYFRSKKELEKYILE